MRTKPPKTKEELENNAKKIEALKKEMGQNWNLLDIETKNAKTLSDATDEFVSGVRSFVATVDLFASKMNLRFVTDKDGSIRAVTNKAKGGFAYKSVGTDTVPAMLSPGEYIVNSHNAAKYTPILRQINAGTYQEKKAASVTIGDVNITIQGGSSSQQSALQIGHELRRLVAAGILKLE